MYILTHPPPRAPKQVTIARVSGAGGCHVLSHSWDRTVGCEALDRSLYRYMLTPPPPTAPPSAPAAPAPAAAKGRGETAKGKGKGKEKQKKKKGCGGLLVGLRRLVPGGRGDKKGGGRDGQKQKEQEQQREQEEAVSVVPLPLTGVGPARGVLAGAGLSPRARWVSVGACVLWTILMIGLHVCLRCVLFVGLDPTKTTQLT